MERYLQLKLYNNFYNKETIAKVLLLLSLFLVPLIGATGNLGYEQIKVLFFLAATSLMAVAWIGKEIKQTPISAGAGLFILVLLVTSAVGIDPKTSLMGGQTYAVGWVVYAYLLLFALIISSLEIKITSYAFVLAASSLIVSLLAVEDWLLKTFFGFLVPTYAGRVVSTFGQPNFYGGFLLLTLPFSYLLFKDSDKRLQFFGWGSGLAAFAGIIVSFSRTAILLALLLLILGLLDQLKIRFKLGLAVLGIVIVSLLLAFKFSSGIVGSEVSKPLLTKNPDLTTESVEKRAYIWPMAFNIVSQRSLTGYGLENINQAFADYLAANKDTFFTGNYGISPIVLVNLQQLNIDRSHNYLLDLLLFSGGVGLLAWLILVGLLFWKLKQNWQSGQSKILLVSLSTYLIWAQFQNQSIVHLVYFWLLVGLVDGLPGKRNRKDLSG